MSELKDVDIEGGKVAVFSMTEAALTELREKWGTVPDMETKEGYEEGKEGIKTISKYRTGLEKKRKEIKAPYLKAGQIIDEEAKRITAELEALETPLKEAKQKVDEREAREKAERIARLQAKVDAILAYTEAAKGKTSEEIAALIAEVDAIDPLADFYDLTQEALAARHDTLSALSVMYQDRMGWERMQRENEEAQAQLKEEQRKNQIRQRINNLKSMPLDMMGKPASHIEKEIERLRKYTPPAEEFGEFHVEALDTQENVLSQLSTMHTQALQLEDLKRTQAAQSAGEALADAAEESDKAVMRKMIEEKDRKAWPDDIKKATFTEEPKEYETKPVYEEPKKEQISRGAGWSACWDHEPDTMTITITNDPGQFRGAIFTKQGDLLKEYRGVVPSCIKRLGTTGSVLLEVEIATGKIINWDPDQILQCLAEDDA